MLGDGRRETPRGGGGAEGKAEEEKVERTRNSNNGMAFSVEKEGLLVLINFAKIFSTFAGRSH